MNPNSRKTAKNIELLRSYVIGPYRTHFKFVGCHCIGGPQESSPFSINTFAEFWSGVLTILFDILRRKSCPAAPFAGTRAFFTADCRSLLADQGVCSWTWILHFAFCIGSMEPKTCPSSISYPIKLSARIYPFLATQGADGRSPKCDLGSFRCFSFFPGLG